MGSLALSGGDPVRTRPFPSWPVFRDEELEAVADVVRSGLWWRVEGNEVARFEEAFAAFQGARFGIAVTSGTAALRVALRAAGLRAGDEVIVPPYTFLATATSVIEENGTPVFVDIDPDTYNLDPNLIEPAITPRTRAIVPVHFAGRAADMDQICDVAARRAVVVIEDAAHAHAGELRRKGLGSIGHMGCFSFQASKNLTCGEGGIVITSGEELADECRALHNFGRRPGGEWYEHNMMSSNCRMTEFQGAILNCQLSRLQAQTLRRERNARLLTELLSGIPCIRPQKRDEAETRKAYHLFLFRFDERAWGVSRRVFAEALRAEGVPISEGYPLPLHRQPIFAGPDFGPFTGALDTHPNLSYRDVSCPVSERACASEGAWLPQNVLLGSERDVRDIADAFHKVWEHRSTLAGLGVVGP